MGKKWQFHALTRGVLASIVFLGFLFGGFVSAQPEAPDTSCSYLYVISGTPTHLHVSLNGQKFGELDINEGLKVKVYSEGLVKVLAYNPEGGEISCRVKMVKGNNIFCLVERLSFQEIETDMATRMLKGLKSSTDITENRARPIVKPVIEKVVGIKEHEVELDIPEEEIVVNDFSYINFINSTYTLYQIQVNGRLLNTIGKNENLKLKIYSEGRLSISMVNDGARYLSYLDVVNNENYVVATNSSGLLRGLREEDDGFKLLEKVENTIDIVEDPYYPLIRSTENGRVFSQGTCFLIDKGGYLLTNQHVVGNSEKVSIKGVKGDFGTWYEAKVVAVDVDLDMALLKLVDESITFNQVPYRIANTTVAQGSKAFVLGYPLTTAMGDEIKVTDGIISARSGYKGSLSQYQFSAAIQPGNSGSPLFNEQGEVVGLINSKLRGAESAGYAIKSPYVHTFVNQVEGVKLNTVISSNTATNLVDQIKRNKPFVFIVKAE